MIFREQTAKKTHVRDLFRRLFTKNSFLRSVVIENALWHDVEIFHRARRAAAAAAAAAVEEDEEDCDDDFITECFRYLLAVWLFESEKCCYLIEIFSFSVLIFEIETFQMDLMIVG